MDIKSQTELAKIKSLDYSTFISLDDPSRLAWDISKSNQELLDNTLSLYKLCSDNTSILNNYTLNDENIRQYKGQQYIQLYYSCPVRAIPGNAFPSIVPSLATFTPESTYLGDSLTIFVPIESKSYYITKSDVFLCPGSFRFIITSGQVAGIYSPLTQESFISVIGNPDLYLYDLTYRWSSPTADNIISYLTNLHTRKIQRGYYSPEGSVAYSTFLEYGQKYNSSHKGESFDETSLPFYEHPGAVSVKLYTQGCNVPSGKIQNPIYFSVIPDRDSNYTTPYTVDIRVLDLNFTWSEKKRTRDQELPTSGYYALSDYDTTYLSYSTQSPGTLVAHLGYVNEHIISLEE